MSEHSYEAEWEMEKNWRIAAEATLKAVQCENLNLLSKNAALHKLIEQRIQGMEIALSNMQEKYIPWTSVDEKPLYAGFYLCTSDELSSSISGGEGIVLWFDLHNFVGGDWVPTHWQAITPVPES